VAERHHHVVARPEVAHLGADLLDHADQLVADGLARGDVVLAPVGPQVRAADARGGGAHDRVGGLFDGRLGAVLETDVPSAVQGGDTHVLHPCRVGFISYLAYDRQVSDDYLGRIGNLIRDARKHRGWTQQQLADVLGTSQSAVNRIERGHQNLSLDMLARIGEALDSPLVSIGQGPTHLRVTGPTTLRGAIDVKTSKNAGVALLCASLLNRGRTTLRRVARIEEVNRLLEVLDSIGVKSRWLNAGNDLEIVPPANLDLAGINATAARRTRSIIMFLGPLLHRNSEFELPYAGGCDLGTRTVEPHMTALRHFGLQVKATEGSYHASVHSGISPRRAIVLTERGDTVTENALMAAALHDGTTVIRNASSNYMVQDLCFYLQKLGVQIDGIGTGGPRSTWTSTTHPARTRSRRCR
jgi:UDP-N-acetylglucosamine 1-carboxyvinyltransferase